MSLFNAFCKVVVMGNVTRDIELRTTTNGTRVTDITLAVNDRVKKGDKYEDETTFVDVTLWGKTAELAEKFTKKGKVVLVEGRLKTDKWTDKESGKERSKLKVNADSITFVGREESDRGAARDDDHGDLPAGDGDTVGASIPF